MGATVPLWFNEGLAEYYSTFDIQNDYRRVILGDLIAALHDQRIAGAALDVTDPEPLPSDSALWRMPNVIITPHVSAYTPVADELRLAVVRENLRRYVAGEPMLSVVDVERGY